MRWVYFIILAVLAVIAQTTVVQVIWLRTRVGYIGPEVLASVAVFAALHARTRTDAALAGWVCGFALDLTLTGPGMGVMSLLYMAAAVGVHHLREVTFRERAVTQIILALLFCLFAYGLLTAYDLLTGALGGQSVFGRAIQCAGLAAYTAMVTPLVCRLLRPLGRWLVPAPTGRERR